MWVGLASKAKAMVAKVITLTKQSLEQLKKKARAATPGPYRAGYDDGSGSEYVLSDKGPVAKTSWGCSCCETANTEQQEQDAKLLAAASPDVILDLIARVEGMQEALEFFYFADDCGISFYNEETGDVNIENGRTIAKDALESFGVK